MISLELEVASHCNMNCKYCFEGYKAPKDMEFDIDDLIKFYSSFEEDKCITFWGGEPTLNIELMDNVLASNIFKSARLYTNGYKNIKKLCDLVNKYNEIHWDVQFSYDGNPIHDLYRLDKNGNPTSEKVLQNSYYFREKCPDTSISFKATLPIEAIEHFPESWLAYKELQKDFPHIGYFPTLDHHKDDINKDDMEKFYKSLIKISKMEKDYYKENGKFLFNWFDNYSEGKKMCAAGKTMIIVDLKGDVYPCHGALYSENKEDFKFGNIYEFEKVKNSMENHKKNGLKDLPKKCGNCPATNCQVCNITRYNHSTKCGYFERYEDRFSQKNQCKMFEIAGLVNRALLKDLKIEED